MARWVQLVLAAALACSVALFAPPWVSSGAEAEAPEGPPPGLAFIRGTCSVRSGPLTNAIIDEKLEGDWIKVTLYGSTTGPPSYVHAVTGVVWSCKY